MSLHKSLKAAAGGRHRSVLKRGERLEVLAKEGRWNAGQPVFGLPKVKTTKIKVRKTKAAAEAKPAEGAAPAAGAASPAAPARQPVAREAGGPAKLA